MEVALGGDLGSENEDVHPTVEGPDRSRIAQVGAAGETAPAGPRAKTGTSSVAAPLEQDRLTASLDCLPDPLVVLRARRDASGAIVDFVYIAANEAVRRFACIPPGGLVGRSVRELLPAHQTTGLLALYCRAVETGEPLSLDGFAYPHRILGVERTYDIRGVPLGDELIFTWRDVSERTGMVQRLQDVMQSAGIAMALGDPASGTLRSANQAFCAFFGREEAELLRCHWEDLCPAEDRELDQDQGRLPSDRTRDHCHLRRRYLRPDGSSRWGDLVVATVHDSAGVPTDLVIQISDVTELVQKSEYLETASDAGIVGVWDWDIQRDVLTWDKVMYRLYGLRPQDFQGTHEAWEQAVHPEDKAFLRKELEAALHEHQEYQPQFRVVWPDGSVHHLQARGRISHSADGRPLRMIGVNYDVTS